VTDHDLEAFVEAILDDRPPAEFPADDDSTDVLRAAIELRSSRSEFAGPDPQFVEDLHRQLAADAHQGALLPLPLSDRGKYQTATPRRASPSRPRRLVQRPMGAVGKVAAAALLVASTFGAAHLVGGPAPVARPAAGVSTVRSGVLLSADGHPLGRAYAYSGSPTWIFMDVKGSRLSGLYTCELHLGDGSTVPAGVVTVYNGAGDWAHTVSVAGSQLRTATLVTTTGVSVASATFS
jgi:hypothetical protein